MWQGTGSDSERKSLIRRRDRRSDLPVLGAATAIPSLELRRAGTDGTGTSEELISLIDMLPYIFAVEGIVRVLDSHMLWTIL